MKESLLHYIWRTKAFDLGNLQTTCGKKLTLLDTGSWNRNAGPDFLNARIQLDNTIWAGHVELHIQASHWLEHGHHQDPAYETVILHVVYENDTPIKHPNGQVIPCLTLKNRISSKTLAKYWKIMHNNYKIPCQAMFPSHYSVLLQNCLDRMGVERLSSRIQDIRKILREENRDWESAFYRYVGCWFGLPVNRDPFGALTKQLPLRILLKYNDLFQIEALCFGQAGMLRKEYREDYPQRLFQEYRFLQKKHGLDRIPFPWKFSRIRPGSFPTIRLAQFAALVHKERQLLSKCLHAENLAELRSIFQIKASPYWNSHYRFDHISKRSTEKYIGTAFIHTILINAVIPFAFTYGRLMHKNDLENKAISWLEQLPAEKNRILRYWKALGWKATSAFESQAMIQLYKEYCTRKKCLDCTIGSGILSVKNKEKSID